MASSEDRVDGFMLPAWIPDAVRERKWSNIARVCKAWYAMSLKYRSTAIVRDARAIKRFAQQCSKLDAKGYRFHSLQYRDRIANLDEKLLLKIFEVVSPHLISLSIPVEWLHSKHVNMLAKWDGCRLEKLQVYGNTFSGGVRPAVHPSRKQQWWIAMYPFHKCHTLRELVVSGVRVEGAFKPFQPSVAAPISTLYVEDVFFEDSKAVEYFFWALVHSVRHVRLGRMLTGDGSDPPIMAALKIVGPKLESLMLDLSILAGRTAGISASDLFARIPNIQDITVLGASLLVWSPGGREERERSGNCVNRTQSQLLTGASGLNDSGMSFSDVLPASIRRITMKTVNEATARQWLTCLEDRAFLPNLAALPRIFAGKRYISEEQDREDRASASRALVALKRRGISFFEAEKDGTVWSS